MTALKEYDRLESLGLWRADASAQRQEVIISFGDATLVIADKNENALSHWSMAAITKIGRGLPAKYTPAEDSEEILEINDADMVSAIDKILKKLQRGQPRVGFLRLGLTVTFFAVILWLAIFRMPSALVDYATRVMPDSKIAELGETTLKRVHALGGSPCENAVADQALRRLEDRLLRPAPGQIYVVDLGAIDSANLPNGMILINKRLVEDFSGPEIAAGFVLLERSNADAKPARHAFFETAGTLNTFRFLVSAQIDEAVIDRFVTHRILNAPPPPAPPELLSLFELADVSSRPFAIVKKLEKDHPLMTSGPVPEQTKPLLEDASWLALQSICEAS